jgi:hypothetical protein
VNKIMIIASIARASMACPKSARDYTRSPSRPRPLGSVVTGASLEEQ